MRAVEAQHCLALQTGKHSICHNFSQRSSCQGSVLCCHAWPTLRVFSNWELMRVIMPMEAMKDRRLRACVMPRRSMRKRLMVQLPLLMALSRPAVMMSVRMQRLMSKSSCRLALLRTVSACAGDHLVMLHTVEDRAEAQRLIPSTLPWAGMQKTQTSSAIMAWQMPLHKQAMEPESSNSCQGLRLHTTSLGMGAVST